MSASYTDNFEHAFDAKGRVTVPAEWRRDGHVRHLHVLPSSEGCLKVYPAAWLGERLEALKDAPVADPRRKSIQQLAQIAQAVEVDENTGRMLVKARLREKAGIGRAAVLVGCGDHFQIWAAEAWQQQPESEEMTMEELMQRAGL